MTLIASLFVAALLSAAGHLCFASMRHIRRRPLWRWYLVALGTFYAGYALSYAKLIWLDGYTAFEHMAFVGFTGAPMIVHPIVVLIAMHRHHRGGLTWMR